MYTNSFTQQKSQGLSSIHRTESPVIRGSLWKSIYFRFLMRMIQVFPEALTAFDSREHS